MKDKDMVKRGLNVERKKVNARTIEAEERTRDTTSQHLTTFTHLFNQQTFNKGLVLQSLLSTGNTAVDKLLTLIFPL